ncbi:hypothetical protein AVEN_104106-1 [Araneus ventricosus]|uniref:Uncharacterized protein n=1 Tax=Araneus ventricosus TaxID=182803 RepID=A0A4Y2JAX5_ARAVE|nr:hypothetical protein AVEN_104106-1 [Araneus ventricosus]
MNHVIVLKRYSMTPVIHFSSNLKRARREGVGPWQIQGRSESGKLTLPRSVSPAPFRMARCHRPPTDGIIYNGRNNGLEHANRPLLQFGHPKGRRPIQERWGERQRTVRRVGECTWLELDYLEC